MAILKPQKSISDRLERRRVEMGWVFISICSLTLTHSPLLIHKSYFFSFVSLSNTSDCSALCVLFFYSIRICTKYLKLENQVKNTTHRKVDWPLPTYRGIDFLCSQLSHNWMIKIKNIRTSESFTLSFLCGYTSVCMRSALAPIVPANLSFSRVRARKQNSEEII